jgi:hypothetical protein
VAPGFGTAVGGILAGVLVQFFPAPTHLVFVVLAAMYALQAVGVYLMRETVTPRQGALLSLVPQLRLPLGTRTALLLAVPVLAAAWSLSGFYASLGPLLVKSLIGTASPLVGGLTLFVLTGSGGLAVLLLQRQAPFFMMILGASALSAGVGIDLWSLRLHSVALFLVGTSVAGMGFGTGFHGCVRTVVQNAGAHERSGVLSIIFIISYLSMGVPSVVAGAWVVSQHDIVATARLFGGVVMTLALAVVASTVVQRIFRVGRTHLASEKRAGP